MCRLFTYVGSLDMETLIQTMNLVLRVSRHDVIGTLSGIDDYHPDGWGIYARVRNIELYMRSGNAIYTEENILKTFLESLRQFSQNNLLFMLHIRAASEGEPIGIEHSHPYMVKIGNIKVVLAHNGAVKKRDILHLLDMVNIENKITDSMALALYIAYMLYRGEDIVKVIEDVMDKYTKTALMTSIYVNDGENTKLIITSHIVEKFRHRETYYRLFKVRTNNYTIYTSSSIVYEAHQQNTQISVIPAEPLPTKYYYEITNPNL